jgi:hypothetical protein
MSPRDRLDALAAIGVRVTLGPHSGLLAVSGTPQLVAAVLPTLRHHRNELRAVLLQDADAANVRVAVRRFAAQQ